MKKIYLFSGLGADYRAFQYLNLSEFNLTHIEWIKPERNESIELYAKRLSAQIIAYKPIFIGLSFGGIMAIEVSKYIQPEKIILISSLKSSHEIPFHFRVTGLLRLHKTMSPRLMQKPSKMLFWLFGAETSNDKALLKEIIRDTDPVFMAWAIDRILKWRNNTEHKNIIHIHGTDDRILPHSKMQNLITIPGGGHFMIINRAKEVNNIIEKVL